MLAIWTYRCITIEAGLFVTYIFHNMYLSCKRVHSNMAFRHSECLSSVLKILMLLLNMKRSLITNLLHICVPFCGWLLWQHPVIIRILELRRIFHIAFKTQYKQQQTNPLFGIPLPKWHWINYLQNWRCWEGPTPSIHQSIAGIYMHGWRTCTCENARMF